LTASHLAYAVLRWVGAAYLLWMGGRLLRSTRHRADQTAAPDDEADRPRHGAPDAVFGGWRQGSVTNLLNPKVGAFYVAVLPQFIPVGTSHLAMGVLLAGTHVLLGTLWSSVLVGCAHMLRDRLRRASTRRLLDRITGTVIGAFGLRLALGD
jgi:threonine/homoserine/homoserine lactone efflux protein